MCDEASISTLISRAAAPARTEPSLLASCHHAGLLQKKQSARFITTTSCNWGSLYKHTEKRFTGYIYIYLGI